MRQYLRCEAEQTIKIVIIQVIGICRFSYLVGVVFRENTKIWWQVVPSCKNTHTQTSKSKLTRNTHTSTIRAQINPSFTLAIPITDSIPQEIRDCRSTLTSDIPPIQVIEHVWKSTHWSTNTISRGIWPAKFHGGTSFEKQSSAPLAILPPHHSRQRRPYLPS